MSFGHHISHNLKSQEHKTQRSYTTIPQRPGKVCPKMAGYLPELYSAPSIPGGFLIVLVEMPGFLVDPGFLAHTRNPGRILVDSLWIPGGSWPIQGNTKLI